MAKFIEVHQVDGTPRSINVDSIFDFYPSVREEDASPPLINPLDPTMTTYIYNKTSCECTRIEFNNDKYFVVRETYDEVCEKIKAATESDDTKKPTVDQSAYMVRGIE